jgi:hypothetical protein
MAAARGEAECWFLLIMLLSPSRARRKPGAARMRAQIGRRKLYHIARWSARIGDLLWARPRFQRSTLCQRTYR